MQTAEEDIGILIQLVRNDVEINRMRKFLQNAPVRLKEVDKSVKSIDAQHAYLQAEFEKITKEKKHLDDLIGRQKDKIKDKIGEQRNVKTNKAYKALTSEIEYLHRQIDQEEEQIINLLDRMEIVNKEVEKSTAVINSEKEKLLAEKKSLEEQIANSTERLKIVEDEKGHKLTLLSEKIRRLYKRILKVKGDSGVANLIGDICQGCYSRVPPQKAHEVRRNDRIHTCEVCGRILVYFSVDSAQN